MLPAATLHDPTHAASALSDLDPTQALLQQLLQQNTMMMLGNAFNTSACGAPLAGPMFPYSIAPVSQLAGLTPLQGLTSATLSPSNIINLPCPISLTEFCMHYKISDSDQQKLEVLEVRLGDRTVELLELEYWKEAGFTKLGWGHFLRAHKQFLKDVSSGIWI